MRAIEEYLSQSLTLANEAFQHGDYPIGCLLLKENGEIITDKNECNTQKKRIAHAEYNLLSKIEKMDTIWNSTLFVTLEPCSRCAEFIAVSGVSTVYYLLEDPFYGWREILKRHNIEVIQYQCELLGEYKKLMIDFLSKQAPMFQEHLHYYTNRV